MTVAEWTAYCAPGHRASAALVLMLKGEQVTEIKESQVLEGGDIILVNDEAIDEALRLPDGIMFEMREPSGSSRLSPLDPLRMLCEDMARTGRRVLSPIVTITGA